MTPPDSSSTEQICVSLEWAKKLKSGWPHRSLYAWCNDTLDESEDWYLDRMGKIPRKELPAPTAEEILNDICRRLKITIQDAVNRLRIFMVEHRMENEKISNAAAGLYCSLPTKTFRHD